MAKKPSAVNYAKENKKKLRVKRKASGLEKVAARAWGSLVAGHAHARCCRPPRGCQIPAQPPAAAAAAASRRSTRSR
jgi:hypothetical protein